MKEPEYITGDSVSHVNKIDHLLILAVVQNRLSGNCFYAVEDIGSALTLQEWRNRLRDEYEFVGTSIAGIKKISFVNGNSLTPYQLTEEQATLVANLKMRKEIGLEIK